MSLEFQQLEEEIEKLLNDHDYTQFYDDLQALKNTLKDLRENFDHEGHDLSQAQKIEEAFHNIEEDIKDIKQRVNQIEFVNRLNEIAFITNIYCPPYLLLNAPIGYGKTRLLHAVKSQLEKQNWFCLYVDLSKGKSSIKKLFHEILVQLKGSLSANFDIDSPEDFGYHIGIKINTLLTRVQENVCILVDNADSLREERAKRFFNQFLLAVWEVLKSANIRLRTVLVGRYLSEWIQSGTKEPKWEPLLLTPFNFPSVYQTVENFAIKRKIRMPGKYKQEFAAHLMHVTGGHPGCMITILNQNIFGKPINAIFSDENKYYEPVIKPVIEEIQKNIPPYLQEIFAKLSVLRMYNNSLLKNIIQDGIIQYTRNTANLEGKAASLEDELTTTYLVERKRGFIQDDIVRRLFVIHLRKEKGEDIFLNLCSKATKICKTYLQETSFYPHYVALEGLYQELQLGYYQSERTPKARRTLRSRFFAKKGGILQKYLSLLSQKQESRDILANFKKILQDREDWEFQFAVNFFLRKKDQYNNEPYKKMFGDIKDFLKKNKRGDNNA